MVLGCGVTPSGRGLTVWATGESNRVFPDSQPAEQTACFDARRKRIELFGAINETVACQIVLTCGRAELAGLELRIDDWVSGEHRIPAGQVRFYREQFVHVEGYPPWYLLHGPGTPRPRDFADVLAPLDGPFSLAPDRSHPIWMDITIPPGTEPGVYRSRVEVRSRRGRLAETDVTLTVWPFALPTSPLLPLLVELDVQRLFAWQSRGREEAYLPVRLTADSPQGPQAERVIAAAMRLLHEHRCAGFFTGYWPVVRQQRPGQAQVNWSDYDALVERYLDGGASGELLPAPLWPLPLTTDFPDPSRYGGPDAPSYWRFIGSYVAECVRHFQQRGWLTRSFLWYDAPAPNTPSDYRRLRHLGRLAGEAEFLPRVGASCLPQSMGPYGWPGCYYEDVTDLVDIWTMPGRYYDRTRLRQLQGKLARTHLRVDRPPYTGSLAVQAPLTMARALPWQAFQCKADALMADDGVGWPVSGSGDGSLLEQVATGPAGWLLWPGRVGGIDVPVGSIRLKQLRRGLYDYEYLSLLQRHGRPELANLVAECLVRAVGTEAYADNHLDGRTDTIELDADMWARARRLMGEELTRAVGGAQPEPVQQFAQRLDWRGLLSATRRIRLAVDGVRVHPPAEPGGSWRVRILTSIRNDFPQAVEGVLRLESVPDGWEQEVGQVRIGPVRPMGSVRAGLTVEAAVLPTDQHGIMPLDVVFDAGLAGLARARGRLAAVTLPRVNNTITIDGDGTDWPVGLRNAAGNFALFGGAGTDLPEPAQPTQQTIAFVVRDQQNLYLLAHCFEQSMGRIQPERSNVVRYEGLIPAGGDMLEILLDPGGAGTGATEDLYHVVIKPNGVVVAERGVGTDPPIGARRVWAVEIRAAVSTLPDRWIVEAAIPLPAFDAAALGDPVWGFNIARFQARLGEYSSWAGAARHMYNTQSLGNLLGSPSASATR
jgi:hypothetical protein